MFHLYSMFFKIFGFFSRSPVESDDERVNTARLE